jgi:hypothetical protein
VTGSGTDPVTEPVVKDIKDTLDLTPGHTHPATDDKHKKKARGLDGAGSTDTAPRSGPAATGGYQHRIDMLGAREARRALGSGLDRAVSFQPPEPSLSDRLAEAALEAAKAFAFPAILIGLMVGFVLVQNRIDHRDPKLALAPVSSEHDYLSFS